MLDEMTLTHASATARFSASTRLTLALSAAAPTDAMMTGCAEPPQLFGSADRRKMLGSFERMNRTIKEATVKRYHYDTHQQLETHLADFIAAYNYARPLQTPRGLTP